MKKLQKKEKKKPQQSQYTKDASLASGLILQSQYSVDTAFTTISLLHSWSRHSMRHLGTTISQQSSHGEVIKIMNR